MEKTNGKIYFNKMIEKRRNRWKDKTEEERFAINEKRRQNAHCGLYVEGKTYNVRFLNFYAFRHQGGIKFGLTKQSSLFKRWGKKQVEEVLVFDKLDTLRAIRVEACFKKHPYCCVNEILRTTEFLKMSNDEFFSAYEEFKCIN